MTPLPQVGKLRAFQFEQIATQVTSKKTKDLESPQAPPNLEKSLAELEKIVAGMESGELTLDESLKQFERGVELTRQCQTALRNAEQKVEILLRKTGVAGDFEVAPFESDVPDESDRDNTP